jgi:hypothetical protein
MKDNCDRGCNSDFCTADESDSNDDSIHEIVNHIPDKVHPSKGMFVMFCDRQVAVVSVDNFFGDKSNEDPTEN